MKFHEQIMNLPANAPKHWGEKALVDAHAVGHAQARQAAAELALKADACVDALLALLDRYTDLVNCGDCGVWNPEREDQVIAARAALAAVG